MNRFFLLILIFMAGGSVRADIINLIRADQCESIIEISVTEYRLSLFLEIGEKDFSHFKTIIPAEYFDGGYLPDQERESLETFFRETFIIKADGKILEGHVVDQQRQPRVYRASLYTGKIDTVNAKTSKFIFKVRIDYDIDRPAILTVRPPILPGEKTTGANIGFIAYHMELPVNDLRYLSQEETLRLNWSDPWYTAFDNRNLARHHKSSLMSFLYIEPFEVRHEVLLRIKDIDQYIDLGYEPGMKIEVQDLKIILDKVTDFLIVRNPVEIDGERPPPILDRANYVEVRLSGIQILEEEKPLDYSSAIIGVIFSYPRKGIPNQAKVHWDLWPGQVDKIPCLMSDPAGPMPYDITRSDAVLVWTNYLKNYKEPNVAQTKVSNVSLKIPYLTLPLFLFIGVHYIRNRKQGKVRWGLYSLLFMLGLITFVVHFSLELPIQKKKNLNQKEAAELMSSLLQNTYRSFDYNIREVVYDKLETSIEGDILNDIYLDHIRSMKVQRAGGAQAKVKEVTIDAVEVQKDLDGQVPIRTVWNALGTVGHWGHQHLRKNRYEAIIYISAIDRIWKITDMDIIEEVRVYPLNN